MIAPLLTTKLYIPPVRPNLVPRPRLIQRLDEGLHLGRKLTLISAPAGFGKTTLLSEWAASCGRPLAWLSLDEGDNDPVRFLAYLVAALQTIEANVGEGVLSAFQTPQPPPIESVLTALVNEIAAIPDPFALVLDDYHLITAQPIHDALTFLLDHLPPQMHLVIATRVDPPLPIARLRGRGQLTELRQTDLRFTLDEAAEFLNQIMRLGLSADDVAALASRTEGWIAGMQMAAAWMQGQEDVAGFIQAFTGSDRYILDYLVEEVLQRQPEDVQTFLLHTAILDRLTGPLCEAVMGSPPLAGEGEGSSQATLERLERANLFIVPLDNERRWYRYHHLFADLLRQRLHQAQPDLVPTLHRRASEWYEQNGLVAEAIDHALSAGDLERAAHLIEQAAESMMMRSEVATFLSWVEALPDELVRVRPSLCLFHAWALLLAGRSLDAIESRLQNMEGDTDLISDKVAPLRALIAAYQGRASYASELSRQALEQLPEDDLFLRSIAAWNLSISCMLSGDFVAAGQALDEAARMGQETGNVMVAVMALCHLAEVHMAQGQLHKATEIYQRALELTADKQGRPLPIAGMALIGLGELSREWDDLEAATRYLVEGIELIRQWGEFGALEGYVALARVKQAQGDVDGARDAIQKAQQIAIEFDITEIDDLLVAMHQVRLWIAQGNIEAALRWVEERGLKADIGLAELEGGDSPNTFSDYSRWYEHLILARVMLAQDRPDEALALLEPVLSMVEQRGLHGSVIKLQILKALAFQARGDIAQAMTSLERARSLAEPEGYVRVFVDEGEPMARLLRQAASRGVAPEYVSKLLAAFEGEMKDQRPETEAADSSSAFLPSSLVEPLSERELEVLQLLTTSLSSTEIAEELVISVHTVRSHIKSIYGKLNVHRRMDAIQRAKELELL